MKTICLNFQEIKKSHFIYALYIIFTLQNKYTENFVICLLSKTLKANGDSCCLKNVFFDKDEFNHHRSNKDSGADIHWDGLHKVVSKQDSNQSRLILEPNKEETLLKRFRHSGKWLSYEEANAILKYLNINHRYETFLTQIPKNDWVKKLTRNAIDKNKTIMYVSLHEETLSKQKKIFIKQWIHKILETDSVCIILKLNFNIDINHPQLILVKENNVTFYDEIHLINAVDIYAGMAGDLEQVAVFLKKPIYLFISNNEWTTCDNGCWVNYLKLCNIRRIETVDNHAITRLAEQAYLLFSELVYDINLNIKLSTQQLWSLQYLVENPTAMMFFDLEEQESWEEKNYNFKQWIIPLISKDTRTYAKLKKVSEQVKTNQLSYIFGDITVFQKILFKYIYASKKADRSIKWINNHYYKHVPVESLVEGIQFIKERSPYGK